MSQTAETAPVENLALDEKKLIGGGRKKGPGLYAQVLVAIALGALLGWLSPEWGVAMRPLATGSSSSSRCSSGPSSSRR